jgi:hypothetical protein
MPKLISHAEMTLTKPADTVCAANLARALASPAPQEETW